MKVFGILVFVFFGFQGFAFAVDEDCVDRSAMVKEELADYEFMKAVPSDVFNEAIIMAQERLVNVDGSQRPFQSVLAVQTIEEAVNEAGYAITGFIIEFRESSNLRTVFYFEVGANPELVAIDYTSNSAHTNTEFVCGSAY